MTQLDDDLLAELEAVLAEDFVLLLRTFLQDSAERMQAIEQYTEQQQWQQLRSMAHSFKGSASNLGAVELAEYCSQLEHCADRQLLDGIEQLVEQVKVSYQSTLDCFARRYPSVL